MAKGVDQSESNRIKLNKGEKNIFLMPPPTMNHMKKTAFATARAAVGRDAAPPATVAQIFNLPYRRILFGGGVEIPRRQKFLRVADSNSSEQVASKTILHLDASAPPISAPFIDNCNLTSYLYL
jgi:hypothetical protein